VRVDKGSCRGTIWGEANLIIHVHFGGSIVELGNQFVAKGIECLLKKEGQGGRGRRRHQTDECRTLGRFNVMTPTFSFTSTKRVLYESAFVR
jgi:hypothetical protein